MGVFASVQARGGLGKHARKHILAGMGTDVFYMRAFQSQSDSSFSLFVVFSDFLSDVQNTDSNIK